MKYYVTEYYSGESCGVVLKCDTEKEANEFVFASQFNPGADYKTTYTVEGVEIEQEFDGPPSHLMSKVGIVVFVGLPLLFGGAWLLSYMAAR